MAPADNIPLLKNRDIDTGYGKIRHTKNTILYTIHEITRAIHNGKIIIGNTHHMGDIGLTAGIEPTNRGTATNILSQCLRCPRALSRDGDKIPPTIERHTELVEPHGDIDGDLDL